MQPAAMETGQPAVVWPAMASGQQPWEYSLRKYLLLLATIVATITYAAGFNPPGGVWQEGSDHDGQLAGDPIIRYTHHHRYLAFFYCNATAFAASLVVIVLILILAVRHDEEEKKGAVWVTSDVVPLRLVMVLDLVSVMGAYAAGTCRDKVSTVYSAVLVAVVFLYIVLLKLLDRWFPDNDSGATPNPSHGSDSSSITTPAPVCDSDCVSKVDEKEVEEKEALNKLKAEKRLRKVLMLLATFTVSITYVAGLSTPGGFWDSTGGRHRPGDPILKDHYNLRLTMFLLCNTTSFVASLLITMLLIIDRKLREKMARSFVLYACIVVALVGLVGAYIAGSCRKTDTTVYVASMVGAVLAFILLHGLYYSMEYTFCSSPQQQTDKNQQTGDNASAREALNKARSLVLLLATIAATITYSAGLDPPGGLWQDNSNGHVAGNPILLKTDARRYNVFFYCNSVAFVASLVAIILVQNERLIKHHVLEAAMILDLFGLIGAYAAGSCRDVNHSIYAITLAGAVLVYVVIHIVFFTLDHKEKKDLNEDRLLEKRRKRLLLFAILATTITYQAGLTPPGGFLLQDDELGHHAGDPVLLYNYPRRYHAFFYCNSVTFMLSTALIILLVNPNLYRPAIRSNALSVCTAVGLFCLMGAYAAGSTQHIKTSIYIFVLVAFVIFIAAGLLLVFLVRELKKKKNNSAAVRSTEQDPPKDEEERKKHTRRKYLLLLGILVASVAYQAGLEPPGGTWQSSSDRYKAGNPVMHDNMRGRYLTFFYSNSISFVASIVVIIMLLPHWLRHRPLSLVSLPCSASYRLSRRRTSPTGSTCTLSLRRPLWRVCAGSPLLRPEHRQPITSPTAGLLRPTFRMEDRQWMYTGRRSRGDMTAEWMGKSERFLNVAFAEGQDKAYCPCSVCQNYRKSTRLNMGKHLQNNGFMPNYSRWTFHGESDPTREEVVRQCTHTRGTGVTDMLHDYHAAHETAPPTEEEPEESAKAYYDMLASAQKPLHEHTKVCQLDAIGQLMALKTEFGLSREGFDRMVIVIGGFLPGGHIMPKNMYKSKKILRALKMPYEEIHACTNDCVLFRKEYEYEEYCPECNSSRYVEAENSDGKPKKENPCKCSSISSCHTENSMALHV